MDYKKAKKFKEGGIRGFLLVLAVAMALSGVIYLTSLILNFEAVISNLTASLPYPGFFFISPRQSCYLNEA